MTRKDILNKSREVTKDEILKLIEPVFTGSDLISHFYHKALNKDKIIINEYVAQNPTEYKPDEIILSKTNRNGSLLKLSTKQDSFKIGFLIQDNQTVSEETLEPKYRNFTFVGHEGTAYGGIEQVRTNFGLTAITDHYLNNKNLGNLLSQDIYIDIKLLQERNELEKVFLKDEIARLRAIVPEPIKNAAKVTQESLDKEDSEDSEDSVVIKVDSHVFSLHEVASLFTGQFPMYSDTESGLERALARKNYLSNSEWELKLAAKVIELSFVLDYKAQFSPLTKITWFDLQVKRTKYLGANIGGVTLRYRMISKPFKAAICSKRGIA